MHVYKSRAPHTVCQVSLKGDDSFSHSLKHLNALRERSALFVLCPCVSGNIVSAVNVLVSGYWVESALSGQCNSTPSS